MTSQFEKDVEFGRPILKKWERQHLGSLEGSQNVPYVDWPMECAALRAQNAALLALIEEMRSWVWEWSGDDWKVERIDAALAAAGHKQESGE